MNSELDLTIPGGPKTRAFAAANGALGALRLVRASRKRKASTSQQGAVGLAWTGWVLIPQRNLDRYRK